MNRMKQRYDVFYARPRFETALGHGFAELGAQATGHPHFLKCYTDGWHCIVRGITASTYPVRSEGGNLQRKWLTRIRLLLVGLGYRLRELCYLSS
jgi:hypothetical protein